jgi:hypothetical protein
MGEGYQIIDWDDEPDCCPACGRETHVCECPDPFEVCEDCTGDCDHCTVNPRISSGI